MRLYVLLAALYAAALGQGARSEVTPNTGAASNTSAHYSTFISSIISATAPSISVAGAHDHVGSCVQMQAPRAGQRLRKRRCQGKHTQIQQVQERGCECR